MRFFKGRKKEESRLAQYKEVETHLSKHKEAEMPFLDHLEEMRITLLKCVLILLLFMALMSVFAFKINEILMWPFDAAVQELGHEVDRPRTNSPFAPFMVYFQIIIFGAIFLALPFVLYFLAKFILPALTKRERKVLLPGLSIATLLFVGGACLAFFVLLPIMLGVSFKLSEALEISVLYDAANYYSTITLVVLGVGISFQLPLLVAILIYVGILKPAFLRKYRRHIFVVLLIFSAIITPPDPVTLVLMSLPLYLLYELAVYIGDKMLQRKLAKEKEEEDAEDEAFDPENDSRYQEREFKRTDDDIEQNYYLNYEEESKYYPENDYPDEFAKKSSDNETSADENSSAETSESDSSTDDK